MVALERIKQLLWPMELTFTPDGKRYWAMTRGEAVEATYATRVGFNHIYRYMHPQTPVIVCALVSLACAYMIAGWVGLFVYAASPWLLPWHWYRPILPDPIASTVMALATVAMMYDFPEALLVLLPLSFVFYEGSTLALIGALGFWNLPVSLAAFVCFIVGKLSLLRWVKTKPWNETGRAGLWKSKEWRDYYTHNLKQNLEATHGADLVLLGALLWAAATFTGPGWGYAMVLGALGHLILGSDIWRYLWLGWAPLLLILA